MSKNKILLTLLILVTIGISLFLKFYFSTTSSFGGNYYLTIPFAAPDASTWPVADDIVIKRESPTLCSNIIVRNPSSTSNTQTAIKSCYFEVAERLRDKAVCNNLQIYSNEDVNNCKNNIDNRNAIDLVSLKKYAEYTMYMQIQKDDQKKTLTQFIKDFFKPHFKPTVLTDGERAYGHDIEITLPKTITSSGEHKIFVKLIPQNVEVEYTISIENPYKINLPIN